MSSLFLLSLFIPCFFSDIPVRTIDEYLSSLKPTFEYHFLLHDALPDSVDRKRLESYLSDADFREVFGIDRVKFRELSSTEKEQLKRTRYLSAEMV
jgi:hypothetical protein